MLKWELILEVKCLKKFILDLSVKNKSFWKPSLLVIRGSLSSFEKAVRAGKKEEQWTQELLYNLFSTLIHPCETVFSVGKCHALLSIPSFLSSNQFSWKFLKKFIFYRGNSHFFTAIFF